MNLDDEREFHRLQKRIEKLEKRVFLVEVILADLPTPVLKVLAQAFLDQQAAAGKVDDD